MAPLSETIKSKLLYTQHDGTYVYQGEFDSDWMIGAVANGGAVVSCMVYAATQHMSKGATSARKAPYHPDPAYLTAHFLTGSWLGSFQVHIKTFSATSRWTRLDVDFIQSQPEPRQFEKPLLRVRSHMLFTTLQPLGEPKLPSKLDLTLLPHSPTPIATICPLLLHPSECQPSHSFPIVEKNGRIIIAEKEGLIDPVQGEGLKWGSWQELLDETEDVTLNPAMLSYFADLFRNGATLLPKEMGPGLAWYPTMAFTIEFKAKFPLVPTPISSTKSVPVAQRTVGVFSTTRFLDGGRFDAAVEVWSAPGAIGKEPAHPTGSEEWRKSAQILALSTQLGLVLPFEVNTKKGAKAKASL